MMTVPTIGLGLVRPAARAARRSARRMYLVSSSLIGCSLPPRGHRSRDRREASPARAAGARKRGQGHRARRGIPGPLRDAEYLDVAGGGARDDDSEPRTFSIDA